jgi:glycosyltransferase involved in cell wall biosynthesis
MSRRMRICHVITTTSAGGAERQLLTLAQGSADAFEHTIISLQPAGELASAMEAAGAKIVSLGLKPGFRALLQGPGLVRRAIGQARPDVVQTWLYHADLFGALALGQSGAPPLVWGVRNSDLSLSTSTRLVLKACAALANRPAVIVANSRSGAAWHQKLGYPADKFRVIPNGFDLERFRPDPQAREQVRAALGIPPDALVAGRVARLDAVKDYPGLAQAAALALQREPRLFFLLIGLGVEPDNPAMEPWRQQPLTDRSLLLGYREDVPQLLCAMDLHVSNSLSEGLSNVVGEAMASGLPNLATDAGDCRELIGDTGRIAPPAQPRALADGLIELAALGRKELLNLGAAARRRIEERYSVGAMVKAYTDLYGELCGGEIKPEA